MGRVGKKVSAVFAAKNSVYQSIGRVVFADQNFFERRTGGEGAISDLCDRIRDENLLQQAAGGESIVSDGGERIGKIYAAQDAAALKSVITYRCNGVWQSNVGYLRTPVESLFPDSDNGVFFHPTADNAGNG